MIFPAPPAVASTAVGGPRATMAGMDAAICIVWWAVPVAPERAPALLAVLDQHERHRLGRLRRPADAARYLAAHALTRVVLGELLGIPPGALVIERTCRCGQQHGKPVLAGGGPAFSPTHSGNVVGVAVRLDGAVGLDVEQVRPIGDLPAIARHVDAPAEPDAFFRTWTRKEALLKATGHGLASSMAAIRLDEHGVTAWTGEGAPSGPVWLRDLSPAGGHRAAVAGLGTAPDHVEERDGQALLVAG